MAKQLNSSGTGQIITAALHVEMERSYLEYAMSVIVGRALPDVRDGLKPVHRRILYAMYELGLTPDRPYRKCARVVGDVLGKYHPHGDQSVYDALVRMVQDFSCRYPLLSGHGNFGSVDNDPPAAMRYTETRLATIAHDAMMSEIGEATVDFTNNFDNSQQEPVVLPVQLPILLLNGCTGIAVGMATNIPPHNLSELVDGLIALIDKPDLDDRELWKLIPGPDFPTGGEILDISGIREAYRTGKGIVPIRGIAQIEVLETGKKRRRERTAIVVTELPYQVNKAAWIEKVAELVGQGRLEEISDIRDESDREGIRVVIELKKDAHHQLVLGKLYQLTALQSSFGIIMLGLVNNKPSQLSLKELLQEFLTFREETLRKQYSYELEESQQRLHLVEGTLAALENLDVVIDLLRNAPDGTTAKYRFQEELGLSEAQADSILAMPMRRLTGLERQKLETEQQQLHQRISELGVLLNDRHELMKSLKKELRGLKRKFGDARRTRIIQLKKSESVEPKDDRRNLLETDSSDRIENNSTTKNKKRSKTRTSEVSENSLTEENLPLQSSSDVPKRTTKNTNVNSQLELPFLTSLEISEDAVVEITHQGQIWWQNSDRGENVSSENTKPGADVIIQSQTVGKREQLVILTDSGKAYPLSLADIPNEIFKPSKNIINLLPKGAQNEADKALAHFFLEDIEPTRDLLLLTQKGRIKRLPLSELTSLTNRGLVTIKLKDDDRLSYMCFTQEGQELAIATTSGRVLRFPVSDEQIPIMGRSAQGNQALRLRYGEELAGCVTLNSDDNLLLVTQMGYGKRMPLNALRLGHLNDLGAIVFQFKNKEDNLAGMVLAKPGEQAILFANSQEKIVVAIDSIPLLGKDGGGDRLTKLKSSDRIVKVLTGE
jgi:DNA gyrase subunit A